MASPHVPHAPPQAGHVPHGPTFATAFHELRRWTDEVARLHEHELVFLRNECNRLNDLSRWQEGEIARLGEQVRAQEQELAGLKGKGDGSGPRGAKRAPPPPAPPVPAPPQRGPPAPPKVPPPSSRQVPPPSSINIPPLNHASNGAMPDETRRKAKGSGDPRSVEHAESEEERKKHILEEVIGDYVGIFKTGIEKNFGYITCDALQADVFVHKNCVGDFNVQVGAPVEFEAYWHKGHLQARFLRVPAVALDDEILGDFVGVVKNFSVEKGFGFITCSAVQNEEGKTDVYVNHKMVGGFDMQSGTPVLFEAYWHKGRLQGRNFRIQPEGSKEGPRDKVLGDFVGIIKNFNDKGFAFIGCEHLEKDVFVHTKNIGDFVGQVGAAVEFEAYLHKGYIQGRHLRHPAANDSDQGDEILGDFVGIVKSFSADKGFGFVTCDGLRNESDEPDIYIHKNNVGEFDMQMGAPVLFEAFWYKGRLQGRKLQPPEENDGGDEVLGFFIGAVKTFDAEKGFGFIECEGLRNERNKQEVFFHKDMSGDIDIQRGMHVEFEAFWDKGKLRARDLQVAPPVGDDREDGKERVVGTFIGVVKNFIPEKGFGFILCEELWNEENSHDVWVHKANLGNFDMQPGAPVEFEAFWNKKGRLQGRHLQTPSQGKKGDGRKGGEPQTPNGKYLGEYLGVVKVFYHDKQFGFIACDGLRNMVQNNGQKDVFLHRKFVGADFPIEVGMEVQFEAYMTQGQVQAYGLRNVTGMDMVGPQKSISEAEEEVSLGDNTGILKLFNQEKGFGFITCERLRDVSENGEGNVWVHHSSIGFPMELLEPGLPVNFQAFLIKGRLQGRNVESVGGGPAKKRKH